MKQYLERVLVRIGYLWFFFILIAGTIGLLLVGPLMWAQTFSPD